MPITKYFNNGEEHPKQRTLILIFLLCTVFSALSHHKLHHHSIFNFLPHTSFLLMKSATLNMLATSKIPTNMSAYHTTFKLNIL